MKQPLLVSKTAKLLTVMMMLSVMLPLAAYAAVWFNTDIEYDYEEGTITGSVYADKELTVPDAVYDFQAFHGDDLIDSVTDVTYDTYSNGFWHYDFEISVTDATYNPITLVYDDGTDTVTTTVYKTDKDDDDDNKGRSGGGGGGGFSSSTQSISSYQISSAFEDSNHATFEIRGETAELPAAALVEAAKIEGAQITIVSQYGTYTLPLSVLDFDSIAEELDANISEITISITIAPATDEETAAIEEAAKALNGTVATDAIDFAVSAEASGETLEINDFGSTYVERTIGLDTEVDASKATGVVYDPAAKTLAFVPTVFEEVDGKVVATLKRNTNSIYTIVKHEKTFGDVADNHWAKEDIDTLASKYVLFGMTDTTFAPARSVTRAEFAAMIVRSLGLSLNTNEEGFSDVSASNWFAEEVAVAAKAGIVYGYGDDTFRPNQKITRQELAAMVVRAMAYAGQSTEIDASKAAQILAAYTDQNEVAAWALDELAIAVQSNVVLGVTDTTLVPNADATRAEAAAMVKRFLEKAAFIN